MENINILDEPFKTAFTNGDSIDYKLVKGATRNDHDIAKAYGYQPEMASDCSFYAKGLIGFSLSSYGDWGTFFTGHANVEGKDIFLMMVREKIIKPWRIYAYRKDGFEGTLYHYNDVYKKWTVYNEEKHEWIETESPYDTKENK